jgi:hypothetical protein
MPAPKSDVRPRVGGLTSPEQSRRLGLALRYLMDERQVGIKELFGGNTDSFYRMLDSVPVRWSTIRGLDAALLGLPDEALVLIARGTALEEIPPRPTEPAGAVRLVDLSDAIVVSRETRGSYGPDRVTMLLVEALRAVPTAGGTACQTLTAMLEHWLRREAADGPGGDDGDAAGGE